MRIVRDNLLSRFVAGDFDAICHQANTLGIMGGGIALQIREQFPEAYNDYIAHCYKEKGSPELLGSFVATEYEYGTLVSLLGQSTIGYGLHTDYKSLETALRGYLNTIPSNQTITLGLPYLMGCGLAGGDWKAVSEILYRIEDNYPHVQLTAVAFEAGL